MSIIKVVKKFFATVLFVLFFFVLTKHVSAQVSPSVYFDYNTYQKPQVLGVFAQTPAGGELPPAFTSGGTPSYKDYKNFEGYLLKFVADATPDQALYPLKRLQEAVAVVLTPDPAKKVPLYLALGGERAQEIEAMTAAGKSDIVASLADDYDRTMSDNAKALEKLRGNTEATGLFIETDKEVAKHLLGFEEMSMKAPPKTTAKLEKALARAEEVVDTVADVSGRPAIPAEMITRLQAYKAQGLLSEEEIAKIVASATRREARGEFRKLAQSRVVPLADVKKFDEAAASFYPDGYASALELRKFKELQDLERERPDEATLGQLQEFAKTYKAGEIVPPTIRSWWAPMVRMEELQATFRPDLVESESFFKYRPEEKQKYEELVARMRPTEKDVKYVQGLVNANPAIANDPAYARILSMNERYGTADSRPIVSPAAASCSGDSHWVSVPFMPGGGYCVPDIVYAPYAGDARDQTPCPPNYHRGGPGSPCLPDNPNGPGISSYLPAAGSCPTSYHWTPEPTSPRGGYCAPDYVSGGGGYPSPMTPPSYCPAGKMFRDGKCEDYNPPPKEGCPKNSWWNGQKCVEQKNCGEGKYQDSNGECKSTADEYKRNESLCKDRQIPAGGCGSGWWDTASCSCVGGSGGGGGINPSREDMKANCERAGCRWTGVGNACECSGSGGGGSTGGGYSGTTYNPEEACRRGTNCTWSNNSCQCTPSGGSSGSSGGGGYTAPSAPPSCGSGYYWNGSSCTQAESNPQPSSSPPPSSPPPAEQPPPSSPPPSESAPPPSTSPPPAQ